MTEEHTSRLVIARLDRIPTWALPYLFVLVIGLGFLFTFFDIFDINVSFIQTCTQIMHGCTPENASGSLGIPVLVNLAGYVVGTLILSPLADRVGRRDMLLVTMAITGIGSLATAFVNDMALFTIARFVTGIGVGADLAIVNTYINEVAPRSGRARYTSLVFVMSSIGAFLGIWLGLILTTPATPLPLGLPFATAGPHFEIGWRLMYVIGALLALVGVLLRFQLPESPRWLLTRGRDGEARQVVDAMEERASRSGPLPTPSLDEPEPAAADTFSYRAIFGDGRYVRRALLLFAVWFIGYVTVYSFGAGFTAVLATLRYPPPEAGLIAAVGVIGFVLSALFAYMWGERLERKRWLPIAAVITLVGGIVVGVAGQTLAVAFIGAIVIFFGFNLWVPMTYSWSTENFPTRARTSGFALVDGVGHLGGGLGLLLIAPLIPALGPLGSMVVICAFVIVASILAQFGIATRARRLDVVSP